MKIKVIVATPSHRKILENFFIKLSRDPLVDIKDSPEIKIDKTKTGKKTYRKTSIPAQYQSSELL